VGATAGLTSASPAGAHPLGNFTINTSAALRIRPEEVIVDYVVDLAEIPTLQARPGIDRDDDDQLGSAERRRYAEVTCSTVLEDVGVTVDRRAVELRSGSARVSFPPGQAGLRTTRVECVLRGPRPETEDQATIEFVDTAFADKLGWREILAVGDRTTVVESDAPSDSVTKRLTEYPEDQLRSPPRQLEATVQVVPGGPSADPDADAGSRSPIPSSERFTELISERRLTIPFALLALGISFVLGAFHALAPGHGKTVMAAYLVGERGTRRHALVLGATVALTHTGGVFALALVVSNSGMAPERVYPWLGSASGLLVVALGVVLLVRAVRFRRLFPTLGPGAHGHHHHGVGGHTHVHDDVDEPALVGAGAHRGDDDPQPAAVTSPAVAAHTHEGEDASHDHDHEHGHDHADGHTHSHDGHDHADGHTHAHGDDEHSHTHDEAVALPLPPAMRARSMMAMGFAGGLVPSPSALVVLLGSIAIGRAWFGLLLIVAYGAGLASVLVGAGLLLERLRHRIEPILARRSRPRLAALAVNLPILTAVLVVGGGAFLVARAVTTG